MLDGDYMVETIAGTEVVTVAKDAFTYAEPLVVNFDGDQDNSSPAACSRLLSHLTDAGADAEVAQIAEERYGGSSWSPVRNSKG